MGNNVSIEKIEYCVHKVSESVYIVTDVNQEQVSEGILHHKEALTEIMSTVQKVVFKDLNFLSTAELSAERVLYDEAKKASKEIQVIDPSIKETAQEKHLGMSVLVSALAPMVAIFNPAVSGIFQAMIVSAMSFCFYSMYQYKSLAVFRENLRVLDSGYFDHVLYAQECQVSSIDKESTLLVCSNKDFLDITKQLSARK